MGIFSIKNTHFGYSGNLKFYMKVNKGKMKYHTKYKVYATSILDVRAQNRVISAFLVLKMHLSNTVEA